MMRIALLVAAICVVQARVIAFGIQVRSCPRVVEALNTLQEARVTFK